MKTKLIYFTILILLLATFVCLFFRGTPSTPLGSEQTEILLGDGMPPNLMTPQPHSEAEFNDLMNLIETTLGDDWITTGSPKHRVKKNDLIEVDESDGDYVLSMQLFREDQQLATENRFFVSYRGPDGEIEDRPLTFLACAMFSNGFLSGSCELTIMSSTSVSVEPEWTFDDRDANVKSKFDRSFVATFGHAGTAECSDGAMIKWVFEHKATEPSDEHEVAESVELTK
jgi:hypothetical protein